MISNNLIYKDNKIIEASYKLSLIEQRIVLLAISKINSSEKITENNIFTITASEYSLVFSIDKKEAFREMKKAMEDLSTRWVKVIDDGDTVTKIPWISLKSHTTSSQSIALRFNEDIVKYLSELSGDFTNYRLLNIRGMASVYSIRIYEMLMRWKLTRTVTLTVDQIRNRLELTSKGYAAFGNIKQKIIDPAMIEIGECSDVNPRYELIKRGNKVESVKFSFEFKEGRSPKEATKNDALKVIKKIRAALK